jgi:predicted phosphoribosyltransferase
MTQMHNLNRVLGKGGTVDKRLLKDKNVILVSDGFRDGFTLDLAYQYLKPVDMNKLIIVTPFAGVQAVDRMHILADDLLCLNVVEDYADTDHYYDKNDVPDHATVIKTIEGIVRDWS